MKGLTPTGMSALLESVRAGDRAAFTALVDAYDADLVRLAFIVSGDRDLAHEAAQAAWQQLWEKPPALRVPGKLRSWLLSVAANEARQTARRRRRGSVLERLSATASSMDSSDSLALLDLQRALTQLTAAERELLALRFVIEMPSSEIAAHLGLSAEGVRTRLHRVLRKLKEDLSRG